MIFSSCQIIENKSLTIDGFFILLKYSLNSGVAYIRGNMFNICSSKCGSNVVLNSVIF